MIPPLLAPYSLYSGYVNMSVLLSYAQVQSVDIVILSLGYFLGEKKVLVTAVFSFFPFPIDIG